MAEFQEVCRQALRMGAALMAERGDKLKYIAMYISKDGKIAIEDGGTAKTAEETEKHVMQWAAEHPEPRYPSWNEWRDANFPGVEGIIAPCAFISKKDMVRINGVRCELIPCRQCANNPIPADIAEKLGVKPIGGDADA